MSATPRSNGFWETLAQEIGNETLPSLSLAT